MQHSSKSILEHQEVKQECDRGDPHEGANLLELTGHGGNHDISDETEADAVGDRIRERDAGDDHEGREALKDVAPVDVDHVAHHQEAYVHEGTAGRSRADAADHGREERRKQEQDAGEHRRETGAPAVGGTGSGLDERGNGRGAECTAGDGGNGVDDENGLDVLDLAVVSEELALLGDSHGGTHGVEEVAHHE